MFVTNENKDVVKSGKKKQIIQRLSYKDAEQSLTPYTQFSFLFVRKISLYCIKKAQINITLHVLLLYSLF